MALTDAQKLKVKHHLGLNPQETVLDNTFTGIAAIAVQQTALEAALTACDTAETAVDTAHSQNSDLIEGGGAKFDYVGHVNRAKQKYREKLRELERIMGFESLGSPVLGSGGGAKTIGYLMT